MTHDPSRATAKRTRLTLMEFWQHRTAVRKGFSAFHSSGKLTQQLFAMAYVQIESNRLFFIEQDQSKLRIERYQGLMGYLSKEDGVSIGRMIILPLTFMNGPRKQQQNYQDAMAIVNRYGKPDYFITMTCNPNWPEIKDNLNQGETAANRPDLTARVFKLKADEMVADVTKRFVLGKCVAHVVVTEFKKRGLPHYHLLIILDKDS